MLLSNFVSEKLAQNNHDWIKYVWSDQLNVWGTKELCHVISEKKNLTNINIENIYKWYNLFLSHVKKYDERLLNDYTLLPNMNGVFYAMNDLNLKQGENVTKFVIELLTLKV
jgi:hypothetical protein